MSEDAFTLDLSSMNLKGLINELNNIDKSVTQEIMPEIMDNAGEILLNEEKRIISQKYPQYAELLSVNKSKQGKKWTVKAGYSTLVIKAHMEVMITEFGRPGAKGKKKGCVDTLGRKIGVVQPYSHIRAANVVKKDELYKMAEDKFVEEIEKGWGRK